MLKFIYNIYSRWQIRFFVDNILNDLKRNFDADDLFFKKLSPPLNHFDRTYKQYLCQMHEVSFFFRTIMNLFFFLIFPILLFYYFFKRSPNRCEVTKKKIIGLDCSNSPNIYPIELIEEIYDIKPFSDSKLLWKDVIFIFKFIINYPFSFWLSSRLLFKIVNYRGILIKYNPKVIAITGENTATSSALTKFCDDNNVEHYNFMSGEMFSSVNIAFCSFHKFYVIDNHYVQSFSRYVDNYDQFVVSKPLYFKSSFRSQINTQNKVDFTYYLQAQNEQEIQSIHKFLIEIGKLGYSYKVRPHLRWTDVKLVKRYFNENEIEDFSNITIQESISSTDWCISLNSSVLLQSHYLDKKIVIDDLSNPDYFIKLYKLDYIIFSKPHKLLSSIIKGGVLKNT
jgi:hypothetical protein